MSRRQPVDLNSRINEGITRGHPADFAITLKPLSYLGESEHRDIPKRRAIVREDTGEAIAVVSDRYALVPHTRILDVVEQAIEPLDVGPVPRGIYVDRHGARMRALYKFPALARPVIGNDTVCPCLQVRNTYDGSERIALHIGAFRFVCTNLAVGGTGAFAGGFVSVHAGDIPIELMGEALSSYLVRFEGIIRMYQAWSEVRPTEREWDSVLRQSLNRRFDSLREEMATSVPTSVFDAYNRLTHHATHSMRSARTAFDMLERINVSFQRAFPVLERAEEFRSSVA